VAVGHRWATRREDEAVGQGHSRTLATPVNWANVCAGHAADRLPTFHAGDLARDGYCFPWMICPQRAIRSEYASSALLVDLPIRACPLFE
jgi:hypothetical protein